MNPNKWIDLSYSRDGKNARLVAYVIVKQKSYFMIHCTAREDVFERHQGAFRDCAETLTVK
jgi:hypothetical protein